MPMNFPSSGKTLSADSGHSMASNPRAQEGLQRCLIGNFQARGHPFRGKCVHEMLKALAGCGTTLVPSAGTIAARWSNDAMTYALLDQRALEQYVTDENRPDKAKRVCAPQGSLLNHNPADLATLVQRARCKMLPLLCSLPMAPDACAAHQPYAAPIPLKESPCGAPGVEPCHDIMTVDDVTDGAHRVHSSGSPRQPSDIWSEVISGKPASPTGRAACQAIALDGGQQMEPTMPNSLAVRHTSSAGPEGATAMLQKNAAD